MRTMVWLLDIIGQREQQDGREMTALNKEVDGGVEASREKDCAEDKRLWIQR